jgi:hypothetical protein
MSPRPFFLLGAMLAITGCDDTPSCEALADHVLELQSKESSTVSVAARETMIANCKAESPGNRRMRQCVMKATSLVEAKGCELREAVGK